MAKVKPPASPIVLPAGVRLGERPKGIEYQTRGDGVWIPVVESLKTLDNTATIQIDITTFDKRKINSTKAAIKHQAKLMHFTKKIKFAPQGNTMHVWSD